MYGEHVHAICVAVHAYGTAYLLVVFAHCVAVHAYVEEIDLLDSASATAKSAFQTNFGPMSIFWCLPFIY